jgi:hypothetical protein
MHELTPDWYKKTEDTCVGSLLTHLQYNTAQIKNISLFVCLFAWRLTASKTQHKQTNVLNLSSTILQLPTEVSSVGSLLTHLQYNTAQVRTKSDIEICINQGIKSKRSKPCILNSVLERQAIFYYSHVTGSLI